MIKFLKKIARGILIVVGMRKMDTKKQPEETPEKREAPNEVEQKHINCFRDEIKSLPPLENNNNSETERKWLDRQKRLRENILNKDPRDFFTWEEIKYSMLGQYLPHELMFLKKSPMWNLWKKALEETEFCEINKSWDLPFKSRATVISNAFKLAQLVITHGINMKKINTIFEFGGGYGSISRLCYRLGFEGTYVIFDLPEFSALQKYFLSSSGLPLNITYAPSEKSENTVILLSQIKQLKEQFKKTPPDIFIATWSLSESPLSLRKIIVNLIKEAKYYLIAYQERFPVITGIDNIDYFKNFQKEILNTEWKTIPLKLSSKDYFLIGKK